MTVAVIVVSVVALVLVVGWFLMPKNHPEDAASHGEPTTASTSDQLYKGVDRPAGPDAEVMDPEALGGDLRPPE